MTTKVLESTNNFVVQTDDSTSNSLDKRTVTCSCNCSANLSTNPSSSSHFKNTCTCTNSLSIMNKQTNELGVNSNDIKNIKERHMSIDSARDSGIGDNSNFTDIDTPKFDDESHNDIKNIDLSNHTLEISDDQITLNINDDGRCDLDEPSKQVQEISVNEPDMRGFWQPKQKRSITDLLPENSFYLIHPSRYIFPGAELYIDPDEKINYFDNSSSDSSDSESETENENADSSF